MSTLGGLQASRIGGSHILGYVSSDSSQHHQHLVLGDPGHCPGHTNLTIGIFDDSGSVMAPAGTDPVSNRYAEAGIAYRALARRCRCGQCFAAVVHFDLVGGTGPLPLKRQVPQAIQQALAVPTRAAGCSLLGPSLAAAARMVEKATDAKSLVLVVFSDFQLFDPDPGRVLSDLASFPGDVHAVVLGGGLPQGVLDPRIAVTQLTTNDEPGALARALLRSLSTSRRGARIATGDGGTLS